MNFILPDWPVPKAIVKSLIWFAVSAALGLLPFIVVYFIGNSFSDTKVYETSAHEAKHLYNDFVILFFCTALVGEITIEAFLCKVRFGKYSYLGFCIASFVILFVTCVLYSVIVFGAFHTDTEEKVAKVLKYQYGIVIYTFIYCNFIKTLLFYEENKAAKK